MTNNQSLLVSVTGQITIMFKNQYMASVGSGSITTSESCKSSTHYLSDTNRFDVFCNVSSNGPSLGISVGGRGKHACFYTVNILKQLVTK